MAKPSTLYKIFSFALLCNSWLAACSITLTPNVDTLGKPIAHDFIGLSFEMEKLLPVNGCYYFHKENSKLITLFKQLGIQNIRLGGNTADRPSIPLPSREDIDAFFSFAALVKARVIYTLRLRDIQDFSQAVSLAKYVFDTYGSHLIGFSLGNEPNFYIKESSEYGILLEKFAQELRKEVPHALICGPDITCGTQGQWVQAFVRSTPQAMATLITHHAYIFGNSFKVKDPENARLKMLAADLPKSYEDIYDSIISVPDTQQIPFRLTETNSFYNAGAQEVSNTMAAALWALDYMHWWAAKGITGINFHTGDTVAAGAKTVSCWYAAFVSAVEGYDVKPLGYALKTFSLASSGRPVRLHLAGDTHLNFSAYAVLSPDKSLYLTLINREKQKSITGALNYAYTSAQTMALTAPLNDKAAESGITLGGASIDCTGLFQGTWQDKPGIEVLPMSALIVKLHPT